MNLVTKLRKLAENLQRETEELVVEAEETPEALLDAVAFSVATLEKTAKDLEDSGQGTAITPEALEEMAAIAESFDRSGDPLLQKQASVLDELLLTLAAPKDAVGQAKQANEEELNRLRAKYRTETREDLYSKVHNSLAEQNLVEKTKKAVDSKLKARHPLQDSLSTRYPPDMPGGHLTRIGDGIYQCLTTGKIYNYRAGYTTAKGTDVPGTSVENQTRDLGDDRIGQTNFTTRENIMSRFASDNRIPEALDGLKSALDEAGLESKKVEKCMRKLEKALDKALSSEEGDDESGDENDGVAGAKSGWAKNLPKTKNITPGSLV